MSQENLHAVRKCVNALNQRDVEAYLACCTDDVELRSLLVALEGAHEGADGIRRFFADVQDSAPDFWLDVERLEAVGADRVLAFDRVSASGRTSGVTVMEGIPVGAVYDFVEGKIKRVQVFADRAQPSKPWG